MPSISQLTQPIYFITGIDTHIGKTYATGYLGEKLQQLGKSVITQKLIQTGNIDTAEDIMIHRQLMNCPLGTDDDTKITMPAILPYPASPHLASRLANQPINLEYLTQCTQTLKQRYEMVLIEGAGGLFVPLFDMPMPFFIIDYIKARHYPVILVTSGRLGSINHTLLSLNALKQYDIPIAMVIYNHIHDHEDSVICQDTPFFLQRYLQKHFPQTLWYHLPVITKK